MPIYQKPNTSKPRMGHKTYPCLLGGLRVDRPGQIWCADITYLPMRRGFLYLVAIMDWFTRKILVWRISNTLEADFCVEALNEAIPRFGAPGIMNTDQGSQFTSFAWTDRLKRVGARMSMDGKGRCIDNVFIDRLWRSLKFECVYLHVWEQSVIGSPFITTVGPTPPMVDSRRPWSTSIASKPISRRGQ
nr:DDE-type integrase/transposase/recombinase [Paracoccus sp. (in: a-proteobacteria)]